MAAHGTELRSARLAGRLPQNLLTGVQSQAAELRKAGGRARHASQAKLILLPTPGLSHRATRQLGDLKIWATKAAHPSVAAKDRKETGREQEDEGWGVLSYHCANRCHVHLLNKYVPGTGVSREGAPC